MIREALGVNVTSRDGSVRISGPDGAVMTARAVLEELSRERRGRGMPTRREVLDLIAQRLAEGGEAGAVDGDTGLPMALGVPWDGRLEVYARGRQVRPQTLNQQAYVEAIRDHDLVIAIGPAGTGKTYLAVAAAVHLLKSGRMSKIILARPAVEAGERLGFLPGGLEAKVNPFLWPLFDALHDMMDFGTIRRFMDNDVIEVVPLAYMRGRTLNNAVVICDEAQNTTRGQMKMFLTRMGHGSRMIVTGDVTQIDLPEASASGLIDAARRLRRVRGVGIVTLESTDVVRHELVQRVIEAYGEEEGRPVAREALERALRETDKEPGGSRAGLA